MKLFLKKCYIWANLLGVNPFIFILFFKGKYGDPVDADSHLKTIRNIYKMLKPGGRLYFSVSIGSQRIEFNAPRFIRACYTFQRAH